ncbi:MAG: NAD(P)-dependent oxidoreductase [Pirellulales bacterium]
MKRVLVTGARGFLGRHCLRPLQERGYDVVAVSSRGVASSVDGIGWRQADLLAHGAAERLLDDVRPTHLLHLAWMAQPGVFWNSPENPHWLTHSQTLLRHFQERGGARVVVAGTCAEYAEISGTYHEQSTPIQPRTIYGKCKHALQLYQDCLSELTGLSAAWGRLFFLYGPDGPPEKFPQTVLAACVRGLPARCSHGRQLRDFLHVQDAADALVALLDSQVTGAVNIASGEAWQLGEMAERLAARCGRPDLLQLGALPARPHEPALIVADTTRLREEVGWRPRIDRNRGLDHLADTWPRSSTHEDAA